MAYGYLALSSPRVRLSSFAMDTSRSTERMVSPGAADRSALSRILVTLLENDSIEAIDVNLLLL